MTAAAFLIADIINSKLMASQPGGHARIRNLCESTGAYMEDILQALSSGGGARFARVEPSGDNVALRLDASTTGEIADLAVAAAIADFLGGPSRSQFRYSAYSVDPTSTYQPRIKAFNELSKLPEGNAHYFAIDRALVSSLLDPEIIKWLQEVPGTATAVPTPGEAVTGALVDFYCPIANDSAYPPLSFMRDAALRSDANNARQLLSAQPNTAFAHETPMVRDNDVLMSATTYPMARSVRTYELRGLAELGEIQLARNKLVDARRTFSKGLEEYDRLGWAMGRAQMITNLGRVEAAAGNQLAAAGLYTEALAANREGGFRRGEAIVLTQIASLFWKTDPAGARDAVLQAVEIEEELGSSLALVYAANLAGRLLRRLGELHVASQMFEKAADAAVARGQLNLASRNFGDLGTVYRDMGNLAKAREAYGKTLQIAEANEFRSSIAITHDNLGRVEAIAGDDHAAERHFRKSLEVDQREGNAFGMAKSRANLGMLSWLRGSKQEAFNEWREAEELFRRCASRGGRIESQATDFLRKLGAIQKTLDRARKGRLKLNEIFF